MQKRKLNKKRVTIFVLLVISVIVTLSFGIQSFAKYTSESSQKALVVPGNFVFDSNYLKDNNPSYTIYDWDDSLSIELYNYVNINKSEIDISYSISVINGTYTITNGVNDVTCENNVCVLPVIEEKHIINLTPTNLENPVVVSVNSRIYDYTLSANFNFINTGANPYYSFTDENSYCKLSIYTSSENVTNLSINWDSNYVPDNNNSSMENWIGTTGTVSLNKNSKYDFIFFKNTNNVCSNITNMIIQNNIITLP